MESSASTAATSVQDPELWGPKKKKRRHDHGGAAGGNNKLRRVSTTGGEDRVKSPTHSIPSDKPDSESPPKVSSATPTDAGQPRASPVPNPRATTGLGLGAYSSDEDE
jgi:hypothetical protein